MNFLLKAINKDGEFRDFSCDFRNLDLAFDFLNHLVARGDTLLDVKIIDEENDFDLPVSVFDGESFRGPFKELENQWQSILNEPTQTASTSGLADLRNRWLVLQQSRVERCKWMLEKLENQLQSLRTQKPSDRIISVTNRYELMIHSYHEYMIKLDTLSDRFNKNNEASIS